MTKIIISYRRLDSQDITMRIRDAMAAHFGENSVFTDIDSIPLGVDFLDHLNVALSACDALIAIVGPHWADAGRGPGQGVHLETDFVRMEVEAALKRKIPVIPALVSGTRMPGPDELPVALKQFAFRNATVVDSGVNFRNDVNRLIRSLDETLAPKKKQEKSKIQEKRRTQVTTKNQEKSKTQEKSKLREKSQIAAAPTEVVGQWEAKLLANKANYLLIDISRVDKHYRLEYETGSISASLKLDGVELDKQYYIHPMPGRKIKDFQVGAHTARFQLRLSATIVSMLYPRPASNVELWCDGRLILRSD